MVDTIPIPDERPAVLWDLLKRQTRVLRDLRAGLADALTVDPNIGDAEFVYMARNYRMWRDEAARLAMAYSARVLAPQGYPVELISFGYSHGDAPDAERVVDVRDTLRDPAAARHILDLTGHNNKVQTVVWNTPGAQDLVRELVKYAAQMPGDQPRQIAIGCAGGRHRSVALAEFVTEHVRHNGTPVLVRHRDVHLPRVVRPSGGDQR